MKEKGADKLEEGRGGTGAFCSENKRDFTLDEH